ncbi:MAG: hypothetical protein ACM3YO_02620 [Bacteroidota bacterium]
MESCYRGRSIESPLTVRTQELGEGDNLFLVHGPFGISGVYPLSSEAPHAQLHCSLYFLKMNETVQKTYASENTQFELWLHGDVLRDEDLCTVCLDKGCPANKNPGADVEERPGVLTLSSR